MASMIRKVVGRFMIEIPPNRAMGVNIVDIRISDDLRYADITVSAISGVDDAIKILKSKLHHIAKTLGRELTTFTVPLIRLHASRQGEELQRLDQLISRLVETQAPDTKKRSSRRTRRGS